MTLRRSRAAFIWMACVLLVLFLMLVLSHAAPSARRNGQSLTGCRVRAATQQALAAHASRVEFHVGMARFDILRIPAGEFEMGSSPHEPGHEEGEGPVRRIHISQAFYLGKYEVTQAQYRAVMGQVEESDYHGDAYPMDGVLVSGARTFCEKLSHLTGLHVALPTEAQWEYACRAGTTTRYYTGDSVADLARAGWFRGNSAEHVHGERPHESSDEHLHEVGQKAPNAFGLYDMLGNVAEMCQDQVPDYATMDATDPEGYVQEGVTTMRGGAWMLPADDCQCTSRLVAGDFMASQAQGFRIAVIP